jgi:hypothetical protein
VVLLPGLVLLAWRQAFNPIAAAAVTFLFTFGTIEWKGIANLVMTAMFIAIALQVINTKGESFDSKSFFYGAIFGLSCLTYFGYLWWSLLAIGALIFGLWFSKNRKENFLKVFDAGLGFLLVFGPSQVSPRIDLNASFIFLFVVLVLLFRLFTKNLFFINKTIAFSTGLIAPFVILFTLLTNSTGDTWMVDLSEQSPAPNLGIGFNISGLIVLIITFFGLILAFSEMRYRIAILVSVTTFISSALMMFWFAARMEVTDLVELYPRAAGTFGFSWTLISLISILAIITSSYLSNAFKIIWPKNLSLANNIFLVLTLLLPLTAIHARTLSESQDGIFPIGENAVWQAYRGCDNPHEDPMLAKLFEERPFIQKFLRENCPKVDWPVIPAMNWINTYPGTKAK